MGNCPLTSACVLTNTFILLRISKLLKNLKLALRSASEAHVNSFYWNQCEKSQ